MYHHIMKKYILFVVLLLITIIQPLFIIWQQRDEYFGRGYADHFEEFKSGYYSSQYATDTFTTIITDEYLESFAAGAFLQGINPILIHHDQPPLGRYIIALSILVFDNQKTIPFLLLLVSALGIYLVSLQILKNRFLALIPFGLFINQLMFLHKFTFIPLLEPIQFPFILFALFMFICGVQKKNYLPWFLLTALLIGCIVSIRYFVLGGALVLALSLFLLFEKQIKQGIVFLGTLCIALFVLLASYFKTFIDGYSLIQVLGIQKYIFVYHKSAFAEPFSYWDLLLFNRWHTWWGDRAITSDAEWSILWPISVGIIILFVGFTLWKNITLSKGEWVLIFWISIYSMMLSFGYTSTRYFLPLIPFLYILATSFVVRIVRIYIRQMRLQKEH